MVLPSAQPILVLLSVTLQDMWRVYKHTGKDKDYDVYKEALNAATNEVRKSKRNCEHKLAQHIKWDGTYNTKRKCGTN